MSPPRAASNHAHAIALPIMRPHFAAPQGRQPRLTDRSRAHVSFQLPATPAEDAGGVHGNDERVTELDVRRGVAMTLKILERFAATRPVLEEF